jgi:hypothetical protein
VSLDNADKVIEGGPLKPAFGLSGALAGAAPVREMEVLAPIPAVPIWETPPFSRFGKNLVKLPKRTFFPYPTDSAAKINLLKCPNYP